jgi:hypothetical protein
MCQALSSSSTAASPKSKRRLMPEAEVRGSINLREGRGHFLVSNCRDGILRQRGQDPDGERNGDDGARRVV